MKLQIKKIKKFYWQVYKPITIMDWLTVPLFKRIVVDYRYYVDGKEVNIYENL